MNPGSRVVPGDSQNGTSTIPAHTIVDEDTELGPFHIDDDRFWTSAMTYEVKDFGYTYPELTAQIIDPAQLKRNIFKVIRKMYGSPVSTLLSRSVPPRSQRFSFGSHTSISPSSSESAVNKPNGDHSFKDWVAVVSVKPSEFPKSGYVHIFVSHAEPTEPASEWIRHESLIGSVGLFVNNSPLCDSCNEFAESGKMIYGQVFSQVNAVPAHRTANEADFNTVFAQMI